MGHQKVKNMISTSDPRVCMIGHPAPAWLVNYADLMTELVCFFIVLYALSAALNKDVQKAKKDVEEAMKKDKVATEVKVTKDGMQITLEENGENVFFESGSAELSPRMDEILSKITPVLRKLAKDGHDVVVEGHTDDVPIHNGQFSSNWELSTARATSVVQHMIKSQGMPPQHMAAIGYGQFHPLVPNDTDEHRAKNRRVVFLVKNKSGDLGKDKKDKSTKEADEPAPAADATTAEPAPDATAPEATSPGAPSNEPAAETAVPLPAEVPAEQSNSN
jgi:flagellar motor protein MotB